MTKIFTVSEINAEAQNLLRSSPLLSAAKVKGEVSEAKTSARGHCYFTLKDASANLSCVIFRSDLDRQRTKPVVGQKILISGRCDLYVPTGNYQFIVREIEADGEGRLYQAFIDLKNKLEQEGLFAKERKIDLPFLPSRIALITSPTGAVQRDFIRTSLEQFSSADILLIPAAVQGEEAVPSLLNAILIAEERVDIDLIVIARGGGSIQDLWPFNDERLARLVAASKKPIISAIGHETDVTILDMVADCRAATPTAAAKMAYPEESDLRRHLDNLQRALEREIKAPLEFAELKLEHLHAGLRQFLDKKFDSYERSLEKCQSALKARSYKLLTEIDKLRIDKRMGQYQESLINSIKRADLKVNYLKDSLYPTIRQLIPQHKLLVDEFKLAMARAEDNLIRKYEDRITDLNKTLNTEIVSRAGDLRHKQSLLSEKLKILNPLTVLQRGYSIAYDNRGRTVRDPQQILDGEDFTIQFEKGNIQARKVVEQRSENE